MLDFKLKMHEEMCFFGQEDTMAYSLIECLPPELVDKKSYATMERKPWSQDMWSLGTIILEVVSGLPIETIEKSKIVLQGGKTMLSQGILSAQEKVNNDGRVERTKE